MTLRVAALPALIALLARAALADPDPDPDPAPPPTPAAEPARVTRPPPEMIRENSILLDHTRLAREAARAGKCELVAELSPKVRALDPTFHGLFVLDPLIAACVNPGALPPAAPEAQIVVLERRAEPPPSVGRLAGELLLGALVGTGGALVGLLMGAAICDDGDGSCDAWAIGGAYAGSVAAIPFGVRAAGSIGDQTGSLGATYLGGLLGGGGGLLMLANGRSNVTAVGLVLAPTIGAVIGFNSTRRYKPRRVRVPGALVGARRGGPALAVPIPTRTRSEVGTVTSIPLVTGTF